MAKSTSTSWIKNYLKTERVVRIPSQGGFNLTGGSSFHTAPCDPIVVTWHKYFDLCYVVEGFGEYIDCQNHHYKLHPGVFFHRLPEVHTVHIQSKQFAEYYLSISPVALDFFNAFQSHVPKAPKVIDVGLHREILLRYEQLFREIRETPEPQLSRVAMHILEFYMEILDENPSGETRLIEEACLLIKSDPGSRKPLEQIARRLGLGYSNFRRLFQKKMRLSPGDYRIQKRLELTCELLSSGLTQKQVAFKLGYTDVQGFSRQFRRFMDIAPGQYLEETQHQRQ